MKVSEPRVTGGELVARTLKAAGVRKVFALHGGHLEGLLKGCVENDIELIDTRHEAAAGHAADAYARTTGQLGVCVVTAGPGFANAMPAITNAFVDNSPVLFIIGAPPLREVETNPLQGGFDQIAMARPTAKWAVSVPATDRIADLTAMAVRKAMTGRKGPVVLELPIDVLHMSVPANRATLPTGLNVRPKPAPSPAETAELVRLLKAAKRPAIVAGMEAANEATATALRRLAGRAAIPVFTKVQAMGLLPPGHPLDGGGATNLGALKMMGAEAPDLVVLLGARMGLFLGGGSGAVVPDSAKVVQVAADAGEIGRLRDMDLAIAAGTAETVEALNAALPADLPDWSKWAAQATAAKAAFALAWPEPQTEGGVHPFHAAQAVAKAAGQSAVFVLDGGEAASWAGAVVEVEAPGRVLSHGYLGCLGIGPGMAIGLQLAHPDRRVVQVTGDGAMGFHIQEFDTMVRHRLPIVTVVLNNQVWGMSIHGQQLMFGPNYNVITKIAGTRYADIAAGFGCHAERVEDHTEVAPAMARAFAAGRPAVVEIMIDAAVIHPVTISMLGQVGEGAGDVMIPYYENLQEGAA